MSGGIRRRVRRAVSLLPSLLPSHGLAGLPIGYPTQRHREALRRPPRPLNGDVLKMAPIRPPNGFGPLAVPLPIRAYSRRSQARVRPLWALPSPARHGTLLGRRRS